MPFSTIRGLQVELHPGRDAGADDADGHVDVGFVAPDGFFGQLDGGDEGVVPAGLREDAGEDVGDVDDGGDEEDLLDLLIVSADDEQPDEDGADRHRDEFRHVEEVQAAGDADEFGDDVGVVDDDQEQHDDDGDAQAELFADEVAEAFASDDAHAGAHLLHDDQGERYGDHHPQERVAVLRAGLRVGEDAARVVVEVGGDEARAEDG